jgi:DNA-binding transcriptional MerR regulator
MRISELARATGVSPHALRHYERLGLLKPSRRIGIPLKEIAARLPAYRSRRLTPDAMIEAMRARIASIDAEIAVFTAGRPAPTPPLDAEIAALRAQRRRIVAHVAWIRDRAARPPARGPFDVPRRRRTRSEDTGD